MTEDLRLKTEAADVHLDYRLNDAWSAGLAAVYDFRQYRLNEDGPLSSGSFRDEEIDVGASLAWTLKSGITFDLRGGKVLWRETTTKDGALGDLGETELSSPFYLGLGLKVRF
ncbi:MAG: hypothetical protein ACI8X5_000053 [Planctomycetota bacterium]